MINKKLKPEYNEQLALKTIKTAKIFSIGTIFILFLFALKDYYIVHRYDIFAVHIISITFYLIYSFLLFFVLKKNLKLVKVTHGISLAYLMIMMGVINYLVFNFGNSNEALKIVASSALGICMFSVYFMSAIHKRSTYLFAGIPFFLLLFILTQGKTPLGFSGFSYFCNPLTILIIVSIMGFVGDREYKKSFLRRKKIDYYQKELERENEEIKFLNTKLTLEIKKSEKLQKKLVQRATIDTLTGVFNRREGFRKLNHDIEICNRSGGEITLCFIDLDNLKKVNDNFGHRDGDEYIKIIADVITECIRTSDYVMRFGGDEFVVVFNNCKAEDAKLIINRVRLIIQNKSNSIDYEYSFSEGYSNFSSSKKKSVEELIKIADKAMYKNKNMKKAICKN